MAAPAIVSGYHIADDTNVVAGVLPYVCGADTACGTIQVSGCFGQLQLCSGFSIPSQCTGHYPGQHLRGKRQRVELHRQQTFGSTSLQALALAGGYVAILAHYRKRAITKSKPEVTYKQECKRLLGGAFFLPAALRLLLRSFLRRIRVGHAHVSWNQDVYLVTAHFQEQNHCCAFL